MIWIKRQANNFDLVVIAVKKKKSLLYQTYSSAQDLYPA